MSVILSATRLSSFIAWPPCRFGLPGEALLSRGEDEAPDAGLLPQLEVIPNSSGPPSVGLPHGHVGAMSA